MQFANEMLLGHEELGYVNIVGSKLVSHSCLHLQLMFEQNTYRLIYFSFVKVKEDTTKLCTILACEEI